MIFCPLYLYKQLYFRCLYTFIRLFRFKIIALGDTEIPLVFLVEGGFRSCDDPQDVTIEFRMGHDLGWGLLPTMRHRRVSIDRQVVVPFLDECLEGFFIQLGAIRRGGGHGPAFRTL